MLYVMFPFSTNLHINYTQLAKKNKKLKYKSNVLTHLNVPSNCLQIPSQA